MVWPGRLGVHTLKVSEQPGQGRRGHDSSKVMLRLGIFQPNTSRVSILPLAVKREIMILFAEYGIVAASSPTSK